MVICLERGANLHMAQLMPLPFTVACFSKIQIGFTFLVLAHLGSPGKGPLNGCVCVCVCVCCSLYSQLVTSRSLHSTLNTVRLSMMRAGCWSTLRQCWWCVLQSLPFVEYELHKQLVNKLKIKGMNSLFRLKIQISVGVTQLVAVAVSQHSLAVVVTVSTLS